MFLKAAGFGAGFAGIFVLFFGFILWYQNRPVPPPAWNKSAITAKWIKATPGKTGKSIAFRYAITNSTSEDYSLDGEARFFIRKPNSNVLNPSGTFGVSSFIPSKHTVQLEYFVTITGYPELLDASEDQINKILSDRPPANLDGFEIFDDKKHYEIVLPAGWKEQSQH